jgi:hypothetical protein
MSRPHSESLRRALRDLAESDVAEIVVVAREQARVRAQQLIEDALVEEMLDAVARLPGGGQEPRADAGAEPADEGRSTDQAWWTYCVLSARDAGDALLELAGIEPGSTIEVVREGGLAALVSAVPAAEYDDERLREHLEDLEWVERTARRHESVLEAALEQVTIVPLGLCTIYRDLGGVHRLLRERRAALAQGLERIDRSVEWGVKVFAGASASRDIELLDPAAPEEEAALEGARERPGATYLTQRQRERERSERASELLAVCADAVHERVSRCAREAVKNPPQRPELHGRELAMILNGAYLIDRDHEQELYETIASVQGEWEPRGFVLELTGPWPPYNFASDSAGLVP